MEIKGRSAVLEPIAWTLLCHAESGPELRLFGLGLVAVYQGCGGGSNTKAGVLSTKNVKCWSAGLRYAMAKPGVQANLGI